MVVYGVLGDGVRIVEELRQAWARVVAVEQSPDPGRLPPAVDPEVPYESGDPRSPATLRAAGIDGAVALICVEGDDLYNLATALVARELRPELRIVVGLRNAAVGRALNDIGVFVVDVGQVSAPSVIEACLRTRSHELSLGEESYLVTEVPGERSGTLAELYSDLAVLAVRPGGGRAAVRRCPCAARVRSPADDPAARSRDRRRPPVDRRRAGSRRADRRLGHRAAHRLSRRRRQQEANYLQVPVRTMDMTRCNALRASAAMWVTIMTRSRSMSAQMVCAHARPRRRRGDLRDDHRPQYLLQRCDDARQAACRHPEH